MLKTLSNGAAIVKQRLFPAQPRTFRGLRWLTVSLRTLHLIGVAGFAGGVLHHVPITHLTSFWGLTLASGIALIITEIIVSGRWLLEMTGWSILFKLILLGLFFQLTTAQNSLIYGIIILSAIIAHAPAKLRHYSPLRRVVK